MLQQGSDSVPTVTPLGKFGSEYHRSLPSFPNIPPVVSAPNDRLLVSWWDSEVHLCRVTIDLLKHESIRDPDNGPSENNVMDKILIKVSTPKSTSRVSLTSSRVRRPSRRSPFLRVAANCLLQRLSDAECSS